MANNQAAVDIAALQLKRIDIPDSWAALTPESVAPPTPSTPPEDTDHPAKMKRHQFIELVAKPMLSLHGDRLPVSVFSPRKLQAI